MPVNFSLELPKTWTINASYDDISDMDNIPLGVGLSPL